MLKNIENFDGWFEVNSYEDIVLGKGELTLETKSLKAMMKYMPIIQELDKVVELNKNEFHIYKGKEKDGKNIKYVIVASDATRILLTYTYNNKGEDEDMEYILKSMRF